MKKHSHKRFLAAILALLMIVSVCLTVRATADSGQSPNNAPVTEAQETTAAPAHTLEDLPGVQPYRIRVQDQYSNLLVYGLRVKASDGATYYASPDDGGSGRHGTANNRYTATLRISGFALVDRTDGRLIMSQCYRREYIPTGRAAPMALREHDGLVVDLWIATATDGFTTGEVGWFRAVDLAPDTDHDSDDLKSPQADPSPISPVDPNPQKPYLSGKIYYYNHINDGYVEDIP